uniref:Uncharacterized protein n=1 Tax=Lepeophtheirus salmonis TaxID=72036 RepID=A0A0K2TEU5_LEPSM
MPPPGRSGTCAIGGRPLL